MKSSKTVNIIFGLLFLSLGIILLGNNIKLWDINSFFNGWWSLYIIIPSIINLIRGGSLLSSLTTIIIGVLLLFCSLNIINWSFIYKIVIPIVILYIFISLIVSYKKKIDIPKASGNDNTLNAVLSGRDEVISSKFNGTRCISIFGGIDLDISKTKINKDTIIKCVSIFGQTNIKTPTNVSIKTSGIKIFGGVTNKTLGRGDKKPTLYIKYVCIFGGVNIR